ncbi:MAG: hotdog domain-containing protein [Cyclobacteriaceae bacterium]
MSKISDDIISHLPFGEGFTFVDNITRVDLEGVVGQYTFSGNEFFFKDHFPGKPTAPGSIMIEVAGQIGVVCYFIYYMMTEKGITDFSKMKPVFSESQILFLKPIFPGDTVTVKSKKIYFRLKKMKCYIEMTNKQDDVVCKGHLSGIYLQA